MFGHVATEYSQEFKMQEALNRVGVSHNAGIVADLSNVQVDARGVVYFCYSRLAVASELTPGDGNVVPDHVVLAGNWEFPSPGHYDLRNIRIDINGSITITKEAETEVVQVLPDYVRQLTSVRP